MTVSPERRPPWLYIVVASVVLVADQLSKWAAVAHLTRAFEVDVVGELPFADRLQRFLWARHPGRAQVVTVFDNFWHFRYVENPGAAWGFLSGEAAASFRTPFFLVVSLMAIVFLVSYFRRTTPVQRLLRWGLALVFGGAVGNFVDRVRLGYVIDFIDWHWYDRFTWPTFNVADAAISTGVGLLLLDMLLNKPPVAPALAPVDDGGDAVPS